MIWNEFSALQHPFATLHLIQLQSKKFKVEFSQATRTGSSLAPSPLSHFERAYPQRLPMLQMRASNLPLWEGMDAETRAATEIVYNSVFQSSNIIPYPSKPDYQFSYQWWILEAELAIFILTAFATIFPARIERLRPVALAFLVMDNLNSMAYLLRNAIATLVYTESPPAARSGRPSDCRRR
ncbi:hypothetical protein FOA52_012979 [Chlamydomonas sp. UWO 241]|nr:hypothetical protein FOA52_012979 [Chlamydomonas sp. UWO 241]